MNKVSTAIRLQQIMSEKNLKQIDIIKLAEPICKKYKVKIGRNDLSQYIAGKVEPRQNKIYILSKALDVNEAWLMGYDVPKERDISYSENNDEFLSFPEMIKSTGIKYTRHHKKVLDAYISKPEMQPAVDTLLGISDNEGKNTPAPQKHYPNIAAESGNEIKAKPLDIDTMIEIDKMK